MPYTSFPSSDYKLIHSFPQNTPVAISSKIRHHVRVLLGKTRSSINNSKTINIKQYTVSMSQHMTNVSLTLAEEAFL